MKNFVLSTAELNNLKNQVINQDKQLLITVEIQKWALILMCHNKAEKVKSEVSFKVWEVIKVQKKGLPSLLIKNNWKYIPSDIH